MNEQIEGLIKALNDVRSIMQRMERATALPSSGNNSTITIAAGGIGVWLCAMCCLTMLSVILIGAMWLDRELQHIDSENVQRKGEIERMQSYLSAIYVNAPKLKPEDFGKSPAKASSATMKE